MTEYAKTKSEELLEASIPGASLGSILCTEELSNRPPRAAEFEKENRALVALVSALADLPRIILQMLANKVLEVLDDDLPNAVRVTDQFADNREFRGRRAARVGVPGTAT